MTILRRTALVVALMGVVALAIGATPAWAAKSCARQIIDDWYKDGRVDGIYELHCYEEAIDDLPEDVLQYSSAREDIERALQDALRKGAPAGPSGDENSDDDGAGSPPVSSGGGSGGDTTNRPSPEPTEKPTKRETGTADTTPREPDAGTPVPEAIGAVESSDAGSVPLPLIVLAGLALLLLAAGAAGYLNRRLHARRADDGVTPPPADVS